MTLHFGHLCHRPSGVSFLSFVSVVIPAVVLLNQPIGEIYCLVVQAQSDEALVEATMKHVEQDHPELVGKISRDDILNWAEEAT